jgi:DNA or RNA helicases of superfamily II
MRFEGDPLPEGVVFNAELRPRQKLAFDKLMAHDIGVVKAPPSFGKTVVSIATIAARKRSTLIIVFTTEVFKQWQKSLKKFLTIDPNLIGSIGAGKMNATGVIDVSAKRNALILQYVSDIVGNYGHIVIDEVHHIAAPTYEPVARRARAKYFLAASATPNPLRPPAWRAAPHGSPWCSRGSLRNQPASRLQLLLRW